MPEPWCTADVLLLCLIGDEPLSAQELNLQAGRLGLAAWAGLHGHQLYESLRRLVRGGLVSRQPTAGGGDLLFRRHPRARDTLEARPAAVAARLAEIERVRELLRLEQEETAAVEALLRAEVDLLQREAAWLAEHLRPSQA